MSCLKKVTHAIKKKKDDYVLQLKANQNKPLKEVQAFYHKQRRDNPDLIASSIFIEVDADHGRVEHQQYTQFVVTDWLSQRKGWSNFNTIIEVVRERDLNGRKSQETSYYIISLDIEPNLLATNIRDH